MSNTDLWDKVCKTDPTYTTHVNQRGGFTAIGAQYQIHKATELWGPYGDRWGVRDLRWQYVGNTKGEILELALDAVFYYPTDTPGEASFPMGADIKYKPGDDCRKKVQTDLTTKALSKLGFNADVFLGLFDDNKYVAEAKREAAQRGKTKPKPTEPEVDKHTPQYFMGAIEANKDKPETLRKIVELFGAEGFKPKDNYNILSEVLTVTTDQQTVSALGQAVPLADLTATAKADLMASAGKKLADLDNAESRTPKPEGTET